MRVIYCDCCKRKTGNYEQIYSVKIYHGNDKEFILNDVCEDCYDSFRNVIDNAETWRKSRV